LITSINNQEEIELVKKYSDKGIEIRHVRDALSPSFTLSNKAFLFTIEKIGEGKMGNNCLSSNDKLNLNYYNTVFENLWKQGIDIKDRIKDIDKGNYSNVEIIPNQAESEKLFGEVFKCAAENEISILLSSATAFLRIESENGFKCLEELASRGIKVKVLIPLKNELPAEIKQFIPKYKKIEFRHMQIR
jgi:hypothetical protein